MKMKISVLLGVVASVVYGQPDEEEICENVQAKMCDASMLNSLAPPTPFGANWTKEESLVCLAADDVACPATWDDLKYWQDFNAQALPPFGMGLDAFLKSKSQDDGVTADTFGSCTTVLLKHEDQRAMLENTAPTIQDGAAYRLPMLGFYRLSDTLWPETYPGTDYRGIDLACPPEWHDAVRPLLDEIMGDGTLYGYGEWGNAGNTWTYEELLQSAKEFIPLMMQGGTELDLSAAPSFWTNIALHKFLLGVDVTIANATAFAGAQLKFVASTMLPGNIQDQCSSELGFEQALAVKSDFLDLYEQTIKENPERFSSIDTTDDDLVSVTASVIFDFMMFAGGLSVPGVIKSGLAAYYSCFTDEDFDINDKTHRKLLAMETVRLYPPVTAFSKVDAESNQRILAYIGGSATDAETYGEDPTVFRIRGNLSYYHERSLNWADAAGPVEGFPGTARFCPGKTLSVNMITAFWEALAPQAWTPLSPPQYVGPDPYWTSFSLNQTCADGAECSFTYCSTKLTGEDSEDEAAATTTEAPADATTEAPAVATSKTPATSGAVVTRVVFATSMAIGLVML